jgi:DNA-binding NtrC family response regulator
MTENSAHKILVIEDEETIREALSQVLSSEGYQVGVAENGLVGLAKLRDEHFSVVISDLKMPVMNGVTFLKTIQFLQPEVPVIIITGFDTEDSSVEAMGNGAAGYLTKPFFPDQIIEKVQISINKREEG